MNLSSTRRHSPDMDQQSSELAPAPRPMSEQRRSGAKRLALRSVPGQMARLQQRVGLGLAWRMSDGSSWSRIEVKGPHVVDWKGCNGQPGRLLLGTAAGRLEFSAWHFMALVSGMVLDPRWPEEVIADVARLAIACIDPDLALAFGGALEWMNPADDRPKESSAMTTDRVELALTLVARENAEHHAFTVRTSVETALAWLGNERWRKPDLPALPTQFERIPCIGHLLLGRSWLSTAEVSGLVEGDAIVPGECLVSDAGTCIGQFGDVLVKIQADGLTRIRCESMRREDIVVRPVVQDADGKSPVDEVPVTMCFTAGQITMTLAQLRTLAEGGIVELEREASAEVSLMVNGVLIGTGELIDINGRLAVEIIALSRT